MVAKAQVMRKKNTLYKEQELKQVEAYLKINTHDAESWGIKNSTQIKLRMKAILIRGAAKKLRKFLYTHLLSPCILCRKQKNPSESGSDGRVLCSIRMLFLHRNYFFSCTLSFSFLILLSSVSIIMFNASAKSRPSPET